MARDIAGSMFVNSLFRNFALLIMSGLLAALSHVSAILLLPSLTPNDSWSRLSVVAEIGKVALLPPAETNPTLIPRSDPMTLVAICRYDLDESGPLKLSAALALPYWGLSAHDRLGMVYYAINNRSFGERALSIRIMNPDEVVRFRADLPEDAEQELLVAAPEQRGFVLVRALIPLPSARARIEAELMQLRCQPSG